MCSQSPVGGRLWACGLHDMGLVRGTYHPYGWCAVRWLLEDERRGWREGVVDSSSYVSTARDGAGDVMFGRWVMMMNGAGTFPRFDVCNGGSPGFACVMGLHLHKTPSHGLSLDRRSPNHSCLGLSVNIFFIMSVVVDCCMRIRLGCGRALAPRWPLRRRCSAASTAAV